MQEGSQVSDVVVRAARMMPVGILTAQSAAGSDTDTAYDDFLFFEGTASIPAATVLGTGTLLTLIGDAGASNGNPLKRCPKGYRIVLTDVQIQMGTAWTGGTDLRISGSDNVDFVTIPLGGLAAGQFFALPANVTQSVAITAALGTSTTTRIDIAGTPFVASALIGQFVRILQGTDAGQVRQITANANNSITVGTAFSAAPDATSFFVVSDQASNLASVVQGAALLTNAGSTVNKGLIVRATGAFTVGTAISLYVRGYFVKV